MMNAMILALKLHYQSWRKSGHRDRLLNQTMQPITIQHTITLRPSRESPHSANHNPAYNYSHCYLDVFSSGVAVPRVYSSSLGLKCSLRGMSLYRHRVTHTNFNVWSFPRISSLHNNSICKHETYLLGL